MRDAEVFCNRQLGQQAGTLGDVTDAGEAQPVRLIMHTGFVEENTAAVYRDFPRKRLRECPPARAVKAGDTEDFPAEQVEVQVVERGPPGAVQAEIFQPQQFRAHGSPSLPGAAAARRAGRRA